MSSPYRRKAVCIKELILWLYPQGVSTNDILELLQPLPGGLPEFGVPADGYSGSGAIDALEVQQEVVEVGDDLQFFGHGDVENSKVFNPSLRSG